MIEEKDDYNEELKAILSKFPFRRQKDQEEKLAEYILAAPGSNKSEIQKQTGISQPTIREIQDVYKGLEPEMKIAILAHSIKVARENPNG